jgi:DNA repair protein RadC
LLLQHFPSIGHVLSAEPSQLEAFGLTTPDVAFLRLVREAARRLAKAKVRIRPTLGNWQALLDYLQTAMAYEQVEHFRSLPRSQEQPDRHEVQHAARSAIRQSIRAKL